MADFDLVLKRGTLYDGTGGAPRSADLGVRGERIAAIGPEFSGVETIDCEGLCVAPGFIDTHAHADLAALAAPGLEPAVRQGITLSLIGLDGSSVAPLRMGDVQSRKHQVAPIAGAYGIDWSWRSVTSYLDALDAAHPAIDLAYLVSLGSIRESIVAVTDHGAEPHDIFRMKGLLARSLDEGAFGASVSLSVGPCRTALLDEFSGLAGVTASRRAPLVVRPRSQGEHLLEAVEELTALARSTGVAVHLAQLEITGAGNWARIGELLEALDAAHREGLSVSADLSPYADSFGPLAEILPPAVREGGTEQVLEKLGSTTERERIRAQILEGHGFADSPWRQCGPAAIVIAALPSGRHPELAGKDLATLGSELGLDPLDAALDLLRDEGLAVMATRRDQSEETVERLIQLPFVNIGSGAMPANALHPRTSGAFPKVLGRYVREKPLLTLEAAVRKMTGLPADLFGLTDHGYLQEGKRANLVIFDAARVGERATGQDPAQSPEGISHVIVGGRPVLRDGQVTAERPGRVTRRKRG